MLSKPNDLGGYPVAMKHSVEASVSLQAQFERSRDANNALYPVDQVSSVNDMEEEGFLILWGDVSMQARHPSRITA